LNFLQTNFPKDVISNKVGQKISFLKVIEGTKSP